MDTGVDSRVLSPLPVTHWSLVGRAGHDVPEVRRAALAELLGRYWGPMKSHLVTRQRIDPHRANDLLQGFVAGQVLERELVAHADQSKGRFRTYLLTALDRYVLNQGRYERAAKRSPGGKAAAIEDVSEPASGESAPDDAFDVEWGREVVGETLRRMQAECEALGRADVWGVFQDRLLGPTVDGTDPMPYARMVERFGFTSPAQASNVLITGKRMFARVLRSVIGEYERDVHDIDAEISDLRKILSAGGRVR